MIELRGANYAFNRTWTAITSVRNPKTGVKWKWVFRCGCNDETEFTLKEFADPQAAAIAARESHKCARFAMKAIDQIHSASQEQN